MLRLEVRMRREACVLDPPPRTISSAEDVYQACEDLLAADREKFLVLHLDPRNRLIAREVVSIGSLTRSLLTCREVFKGAMLNNTAAILLVHNHPSGDPEPSEEDLQVTRRLRQAGELLGVPVVDHVVVGREGYRSLLAAA